MYTDRHTHTDTHTDTPRHTHTHTHTMSQPSNLNESIKLIIMYTDRHTHTDTHTDTHRHTHTHTHTHNVTTFKPERKYQTHCSAFCNFKRNNCQSMFRKNPRCSSVANFLEL